MDGLGGGLSITSGYLVSISLPVIWTEFREALETKEDGALMFSFLTQGC